MSRKWLVTVYAGLGSLLAALLAVVSGLAVGAVPPSWHWAHDSVLLWGVTAGLVLAGVAVAAVQARSQGNGEQPGGPAVQVGKISAGAVIISAVAQTVSGTGKRPGPAAGWPLDAVTDPLALEVHPAVRPEDTPPGLPALPPYVPREHDTDLGSVVRAAAGGSSRIAVLVGGSSTGKTRACWEALQLLRDRPGQWRLWHPIAPSHPDAALREMPAVRPRTVVWLNETQLYLDPPADVGLGEQVAARLRDLLQDPVRAPVLVLAMLWPQFWDRLTTRPAEGANPHAQARELLDGRDITVPDAFTPAQLQRLKQAGDARLAQAAAGAQDRQVIQFLAGAHELLARYRNAPPAAAALINAAMDARRLDMGIGLPQAFLEAAAPGYLTGTEWDALDGDRLKQTLANLGTPAKGVRGPLTRIRPDPGNDAQLADGQVGSPGRRLYQVADYLDQYGRHHRKGQFPPAGFWAAAAGHAFPSDQAALGDAAHARGLYRNAAQLHKNAAARGNLHAVFYLANPPHYLRNDIRPVRWAIDHVPLDDPDGVAALLGSLREAGAQEQVTALAERAAAQAVLDDPGGVAVLLDSLREAGAPEQAAALAERAAAQAVLDDPGGVAVLLGSLREAGAAGQVTALAERAAAQAVLDDPGGVASLLDWLREAGAQGQVTALLARAPAAQVVLDDPRGVAILLGSLREAGAPGQVTALAKRAAKDVPVASPVGVAVLLDGLREAGAPGQVTALADRAAVQAVLDDPGGVAALLARLREAGAQEQAAALLARAPAARAVLDDLFGVAMLLGSLREAGAPGQVTALAKRAAKDVPVASPGGVAMLLNSLREAGAPKQAAALAKRAAVQAPRDNPGRVAILLDSLREAGAPGRVTALAERAAVHAPLDDPGGVAVLLDWLREAGAQHRVTALAKRAAAQAALNDPRGVAILLNSLRKAGAQHRAILLGSSRKAGTQHRVTALAKRAAAQAALNDPRGVAVLLGWLREADAQDQVTALLARTPAAQVALDDPYAVADLLDALREAGAQDQVMLLIDRLPGEGSFGLFCRQGNNQALYRFGLNPDGSPAEPWGWEDLD